MLKRFCQSVAVEGSGFRCTCRASPVARSRSVHDNSEGARTAKEIAGTTLEAFIFAA